MALKDWKKQHEDNYVSKTNRMLQFGENKGGFPVYKEGNVYAFVDHKIISGKKLYQLRVDLHYMHGNQIFSKFAPKRTNKKDAHKDLMKLIKSDYADPEIVFGYSGRL